MSLSLSITRAEICRYVADQLNYMYPDSRKVKTTQVEILLDVALARFEVCFSVARPRRFWDGKSVKFNHLYSDQYLVFLWLLSNEAYLNGDVPGLADKLYCCNKALHGFDCVYSNQLPAHFMIVHGVGTVLGNAKYSDYFVAYHGCTIGQNNGRYPKMASGVGLGTGASVLGDSEIGQNVSVGAGVTLVGQRIPNDRVVWRDASGSICVAERTTHSIAREYFEF